MLIILCMALRCPRCSELCSELTLSICRTGLTNTNYNRHQSLWVKGRRFRLVHVDCRHRWLFYSIRMILSNTKKKCDLIIAINRKNDTVTEISVSYLAQCNHLHSHHISIQLTTHHITFAKSAVNVAILCTFTFFLQMVYPAENKHRISTHVGGSFLFWFGSISLFDDREITFLMVIIAEQNDLGMNSPAMLSTTANIR